MHVVIYEGSRWAALAPMSLSRPVFTIGAGTGTLLDKQIRFLQPTRLSLWVRPELAEWTRVHLVPQLKVRTTVNEPLNDEPALLYLGRTLHLSRFEEAHEECVVIEEGDLIRKAWVTRPGLGPIDVMTRSDRWKSLLDLPHTMPQARFVENAWDLISWNEEALIVDSMSWRDHAKAPPKGPYYLVNDDDVLVDRDVKLDPGCVLDAERGPVMIGRGASIGANSVIQGPCYIGPYSQISPLTIIRPGTSIGPLCKIGGEVSNTIIFGATNKPHEGFLGDSYLGKWCNLGAGTTVSNLKNTYGEVDMHLRGKPVPTGKRFLGMVMGDHTKTAINTRMTAGSYVGFNSMIAVSGTCPKFVPSFTFLTDQGAQPYEMDKAIDVARRVLDRRNRRWTEIEENNMHYAAAAAKLAET